MITEAVRYAQLMHILLNTSSFMCCEYNFNKTTWCFIRGVRSLWQTVRTYNFTYWIWLQHLVGFKRYDNARTTRAYLLCSYMLNYIPVKRIIDCVESQENVHWRVQFSGEKMEEDLEKATIWYESFCETTYKFGHKWVKILNFQVFKVQDNIFKIRHGIFKIQHGAANLDRGGGHV